MTVQGLTLEVARRVAREVCAREGVELVLPDDPRREIVALCVAATSDWSRDEVHARVSVTLPGAGPVSDALALVPVVGPALAGIVRLWGDERPQIYIAPDVWADPVLLPCVLAHELVHARRCLRAARSLLGSYRWALGYGAIPEIRGAEEGGAYTQDAAGRVYLAGLSPAAAVAGAQRSLGGYRLDPEALALAHDELAVVQRSLEAGALIGGPILDVLRSLRDAGVTGLPELP